MRTEHLNACHTPARTSCRVARNICQAILFRCRRLRCRLSNLSFMCGLLSFITPLMYLTLARIFAASLYTTRRFHRFMIFFVEILPSRLINAQTMHPLNLSIRLYDALTFEFFIGVCTAYSVSSRCSPAGQNASARQDVFELNLCACIRVSRFILLCN